MIIGIVVLNILVVTWNFDVGAKHLDNEKNSTSIPKYNNYLRGGDFDWEAIEVI